VGDAVGCGERWGCEQQNPEGDSAGSSESDGWSPSTRVTTASGIGT
jgi:hypothetical protein